MKLLAILSFNLRFFRFLAHERAFASFSVGVAVAVAVAAFGVAA